MHISTFSRRAALGLMIVAALAPSSAFAGGSSQGDPQFDPFRTHPPQKPKATDTRVQKPTEVPAPPFAERVKACESKAAELGKGAAGTPCPYLVRELRVTGVFEGDKPGAFAVGQPSGETIFLQPGDKLYDGVVLAVTEATVNEPATVVLRQVTKFQSRGKVTSQESKVTLTAAE